MAMLRSVTFSFFFGVASTTEVFTTNAVCLKKNCINPIFPGLEDLHRLEQASWLSTSRRKAGPYMNFCRNAVNYDPAIPMLDDADQEAMVRKQDGAALTMFMYHLAGMGKDGWSYQKPEFADDCVKSIWRMVCFTYFPRAPIGAQEGMATRYIRPCQSCCQNYIRTCGVECCDESVQCVFSHRKSISPTFTITQTGYVPHDGPSSLCTGAARRLRFPGLLTWALLGLHGAWFFDVGSLGFSFIRGFSSKTVILTLAVAIAALGFQGCDLDVPTHSVGNWRAEPDYLISFEFVPPGAPARDALLNSCALPQLSPTVQCSGRGVCRVWDEVNVENPVAFCFCDRDFADPECSTRRKSQLVAYILSVFFGAFGADQFYMGFPVAGTLKLCSLGGFGIWWIADIIRIGSAPVEAYSFRLAADFPHWAFVLCTVSLGLIAGFIVANILLVGHVQKKRKDALLMQANEEHRLTAGGRQARLAGDSLAMEKFAIAHPGMTDYGATGGQTLPPAGLSNQSWRRERIV